ncbi:MAG: V-type ATP synthase subunit F [Candidatus Micrarchaeota archaeon]|nr:V-type ATP synthase subunit F [Candidatus Micrarchaeota archaeon]
MESKEKIAVIADEATVTGFQLAGVEHGFALSGQEAEAKLAELLSDSSYGIIIVHEKLMESCDWRLKKRVEATAKPIVVPIPDSQGPIEQSESISVLVKRALGLDLGKKKA